MGLTKELGGWTALHVASRYGHASVCEALIRKGATVHAVDRCVRRSGSGARYSPFSHRKGWTSLHFAARAGHNDVVKLLLQHGADVHCRVTRRQWTPLYLAVSEGHFETSKLLLDAGSHVNAHSTMHVACTHNNVDIVQLLIDAGGDVNKQNEVREWDCRQKTNHSQFNYTPIDFAFYFNHLGVIKLLLRNKALIANREVSPSRNPAFWELTM